MGISGTLAFCFLDRRVAVQSAPDIATINQSYTRLQLTTVRLDSKISTLFVFTSKLSLHRWQTCSVSRA